MINSILKRYTDLVLLHNICKPNPLDWNYWKEWEEEYKPINNIQDCWYKNISDSIILKELEETIKKSPTSKETGPHGISNEML
ncbi:5788_t:CDS:2 [Cetraspora pellucida]|uniref:5788_t:CDS:1 n=1 Tax=Cetraspora pellucida TaxID=1433469 RepID=A0A9N9HUT4_9GLOM|nr:5788_t:CDS:2 [Cetraspora pellucida]